MAKSEETIIKTRLEIEGDRKLQDSLNKINVQLKKSQEEMRLLEKGLGSLMV